MTHTLFVSCDAGLTYGLDCQAKSIEDLQERCDELNAKMLRWYVENEKGEMCDVISDVHAGILSFLERMNARNPID